MKNWEMEKDLEFNRQKKRNDGVVLRVTKLSWLEDTGMAKSRIHSSLTIIPSKNSRSSSSRSAVTNR